jgi:hypothetical protein
MKYWQSAVILLCVFPVNFASAQVTQSKAADVCAKAAKEQLGQQGVALK